MIVSLVFEDIRSEGIDSKRPPERILAALVKKYEELSGLDTAVVMSYVISECASLKFHAKTEVRRAAFAKYCEVYGIGEDSSHSLTPEKITEDPV